MRPLAFEPDWSRRRGLLIAEDAGIPLMIGLADRLRAPGALASWQPLVLLGSDTAFPFRTRPSQIVVAGIPDGCIACMPLLDQWGVASRLASRSDFPGCFEGSVTQLAERWLQALSQEGLAEVGMFSCGPPAMLEATAGLAQRYGLPWQGENCVQDHA